MPGQNPTKVFETDVNQVAPGSQRGGWVSGTPAAAADGATITSLFDLGSDWDQYPVCRMFIRVDGATSLSSIFCSSRDDAVASANQSRRLGDENATGATGMAFTVTAAAIGASMTFRPAGRYLVVSAVNTAGAGVQGANAKFTIAAYAD